MKKYILIPLFIIGTTITILAIYLFSLNYFFVDDGLYYARKFDTYYWDDPYLDYKYFFNFKYEKPIKVENQLANEFLEIISDDDSYENGHFLGTCYIDACFLEVKNYKIVNRYYATCGYVQFVNSDNVNSGLLKEKVIVQIDSICNNIK